MIFPDTSFLCSLYRQQVDSPLAIAFMGGLRRSLPVSSFLLLEFRQSVRLQVRLHSNGMTKGFARPEATEMLRLLQMDLATGVLELQPVDWSEVHEAAERLSAGYTEGSGHRLADIVHVSTALHLGAAEFLTFDANQRKLAEAEGMNVPL